MSSFQSGHSAVIKDEMIRCVCQNGEAFIKSRAQYACCTYIHINISFHMKKGSSYFHLFSLLLNCCFFFIFQWHCFFGILEFYPKRTETGSTIDLKYRTIILDSMKREHTLLKLPVEMSKILHTPLFYLLFFTLRNGENFQIRPLNLFAP